VGTLTLVFPKPEHKALALAYKQEHIDHNESHIHGSAMFFQAESYEAWLDMITDAQTNGKKMLALALKKCRVFGIEKILVTCDKTNIASAKTAKTAIRNGGVLENEITDENGNILQRYWIAIG
jgi:predicted acetyltransferase